MLINIIRCDKTHITDEKLREVLNESFKYINEILSPARKEWKEKVKLIIQHSLPPSSFKGNTLIVGCVHSKENFKDGSDHRHEGIYTINKNSLDGFEPDLKVDITRTYFIQRVFPQGEQFQTIYLEHITVPPLSSANTFKSILHLLKPGGRLIFDHYSSYGYMKTRPSSIADHFSVIIGSTKLFEVQFDIPATDLEAYKTAIAKVGAQLMVINDNPYLYLNKKSFKEKRKLIEPCMKILMKKYIESMGFVNISFKTVRPNIYNQRKESYWVYAQKP
jgi:SAM-dependent methyltransferase